MGLNPIFIPIFGGKPGNSLVKQTLSAQPLLPSVAAVCFLT